MVLQVTIKLVTMNQSPDTLPEVILTMELEVLFRYQPMVILHYAGRKPSNPI